MRKYLGKNYNFILRGKQAGFTLIELMVVLTIMAVMLGLILLNFGRERSVRNVKLAQAELITNLRKAQGYALSAKALDSSTSVQFYLVRLEAGSSTYHIEAVYDYFSGNPKLQIVETFTLPSNLTIPKVGGMSIERPFSPELITGQQCVLIAFKVPYGEIVTFGKPTSTNPVCNFNNFTYDDYGSLVNFVANPTAPTNPTVYTSNNSRVTIVLQDLVSSEVSRKVTVCGLSGKITSLDTSNPCELP